MKNEKFIGALSPLPTTQFRHWYLFNCAYFTNLVPNSQLLILIPNYLVWLVPLLMCYITFFNLFRSWWCLENIFIVTNVNFLKFTGNFCTGESAWLVWTRRIFPNSPMPSMQLWPPCETCCWLKYLFHWSITKSITISCASFFFSCNYSLLMCSQQSFEFWRFCLYSSPVTTEWQINYFNRLI